MDDRELVGRLRARLHQRFDGAPPPAGLAASIQAAMATAPRRIGFDVRLRGLRLGWMSVAAIAIAAVALVVAANLVGPLGPATRPTASPAPSTSSPSLPAFGERQFIVLAPSGLPAKPDSSLASDVMAARLRTLGIGTFVGSIGNAIEFRLPADGPSDGLIMAVLGATGDVRFVPLPPADYPDAGSSLVVGGLLPKDEPALFGWEGIESAALDTSQPQVSSVVITLKPTARAAFADYTAAHVGEYSAILVDGRVAALPVIREPIPGGQVTITGGGLGPDDAFQRLAAILVGGMLPEAWRGAVVPPIIGAKAAVDAALAQNPGTTATSAELDAQPRDAGWRAVWRVVLEGQFRACIPGPSGDPSCLEATTREFVLDAETGELLSSGPPTQ